MGADVAGPVCGANLGEGLRTAVYLFRLIIMMMMMIIRAVINITYLPQRCVHLTGSIYKDVSIRYFCMRCCNSITYVTYSYSTKNDIHSSI